LDNNLDRQPAAKHSDPTRIVAALRNEVEQLTRFATVNKNTKKQ